MNTTYAFWAIAAACVVVALAFLLPPLLRRRQRANWAGRRSINIAVYRDQMKEMEVDHHNGLLTDEQFAAAKLELEARLAQDALQGSAEAAPVSRGGRVLGIVLGLALPLAAVGLYLQLGNPEAMNPSQVMARGQHDLATMLAKLEQKVKEDPGNGKGWMMLGQGYGLLGRWDEAVDAYNQAIKLQPNDAAPVSHLAEVEAMRADRVLDGKPIALVRKALAIDPQDHKALELSGIYAFQSKQYGQAADFFERLYKQLDPESAYAQDIAGAVEEARRLANPGAKLDDLSAPPGDGGSIGGQLDVAPALKAKLAANDTVFLFARPLAGGPPLAAMRIAAGSLPLKFELTDAMAMSPDTRLSSAREVELVARVSKSGDIMGAPGDLEGGPAKVKVGAHDVKLVIDKVRQ